MERGKAAGRRHRTEALLELSGCHVRASGRSSPRNRPEKFSREHCRNIAPPIVLGAAASRRVDEHGA
jgi:hypothetical protein